MIAGSQGGVGDEYCDECGRHIDYNEGGGRWYYVWINITSHTSYDICAPCRFSLSKVFRDSLRFYVGE